MDEQDFVYSRIGMALVAAQRVEFITGMLVEHLKEFGGSVYRITTVEFLSSSAKAKMARITLGGIFALLKLNTKLVIADELDTYLVKRNKFVHGFYAEYLQRYSPKQTEIALNFLYDFGQHSTRLERFFKGFIYFLALRHVKDRSELDESFKIWDDDFNYFMISLKSGSLQDDPVV